MNLPSLSQSIVTAPRRSNLAHTDDLPLAVLPVKPIMYGNVVSCMTQHPVLLQNSSNKTNNNSTFSKLAYCAKILRNILNE